MPHEPDRPRRDLPRIRIGCDVHPISEIAETIEMFGEGYLNRVFTPVERAQSAGPMAVERIAGLFAAKEAVLRRAPGAEQGDRALAVDRGAHRSKRCRVRRC